MGTFVKKNGKYWWRETHSSSSWKVCLSTICILYVRSVMHVKNAHFNIFVSHQSTCWPESFHARMSILILLLVSLFFCFYKNGITFVHLCSQVVLCLSRKSISSILLLHNGCHPQLQVWRPPLDPTKWLISFSLEGEQTKTQSRRDWQERLHARSSLIARLLADMASRPAAAELCGSKHYKWQCYQAFCVFVCVCMWCGWKDNRLSCFS